MKKITVAIDGYSSCGKSTIARQLAHYAGKHMDKAGAYAVQDDDDPFIEKIVGSRTNVVGFPVEFYQQLQKEFNK